MEKKLEYCTYTRAKVRAYARAYCAYARAYRAYARAYAHETRAYACIRTRYFPYEPLKAIFYFSEKNTD